MLRKIFFILILFFVILRTSPLFIAPAHATGEFGQCSLLNKPTNLTENDNLFPANITINTNSQAIPSHGYYVVLFKPSGGQGNEIKNDSGPILFFPREDTKNIIVDIPFDREGNTVGNHEGKLEKGIYYIGIAEEESKDLKCQSPIDSPAMAIEVAKPPPPVSCNFTYDPPNPDILTQGINISITGEGFTSTEKYKVTLSGPAAPLTPPGGRTSRMPTQLVDLINGKMLNTNWNFMQYQREENHLKKGELFVSVFDNSNSLQCSNSANPLQVRSIYSGGDTCSITPDPANTLKPGDPIKFIANFSNRDSGETTHHTYIRVDDDKGATRWDRCGDLSQSELASKWVTTDPIPRSGTYYLRVNDNCSANENKACDAYFTIDQNGGRWKKPSTEKPPAEKANPLNTPCGKSLTGDDEKANTKDGECLSIFSALGWLPTDPLELIPKILSVILGISGGIVILLIIRSGYKLMFSQGNPEKVQEAKDELTSAIVGLLFIIFSFVLLQFITNDLLKIQDLPKGEGLKTK